MNFFLCQFFLLIGPFAFKKNQKKNSFQMSFFGGSKTFLSNKIKSNQFLGIIY